MRRFFDLPHHDQALLLVRMVQLIAKGDAYTSIEEVAARRSTSPQLLWLKICADEGLDACEPWPGFPALPRDFTFNALPSEAPAPPRWVARINNSYGA